MPPALDVVIPDLSFPALPVGSAGIPWDFRILLYKGGALVSRKADTLTRFDRGEYGAPLSERIPLVVALHEAATAMLVSGMATSSVKAHFRPLWMFWGWAETQGAQLCTPNAVSLFISWTEHLLQRVRIDKGIGERSAYQYGLTVATILSRALDVGATTDLAPGALMRLTRLRPPIGKVRHVDKQDLERTAMYGQFLAELCTQLTIDVIRGPIPVRLNLSDSKVLVLRVRTSVDPVGDLKGNSNAKALRRRRAALTATAPIAERRPSLVNLRIEAEYLIFLAQTGMNAVQAQLMQRAEFRFQTDGSDLLVFKVSKNRRHGEAFFRAFKDYKEWLARYIAWLDTVGIEASDRRLFPFVQHNHIAASDSIRDCSAIERCCRQCGVPYVRPRQLRNTRQNWLLRRSGDPEMTAALGAHGTEVLLRTYERPHHQTALAEVAGFHKAYDPTAAPGPGLCGDPEHVPHRILDAHPASPEPDCISPDGCLFCVHHRDVVCQDYVWKLASHARLKQLEADSHLPSSKQRGAPHPAQLVVDRINAKLEAIAASGEEGATWVREAREDIWAGKYHPAWDGFIQLMELQT